MPVRRAGSPLPGGGAVRRPTRPRSASRPTSAFRGFFVATRAELRGEDDLRRRLRQIDASRSSAAACRSRLPSGFYIEFGVTRFKKTGQRAFVSNGQAFPLGIPLTATITPIEFSAGYRFGATKWKVIPYAAGGIGRYNYKEESDFSADGDAVDAHGVGYLANGGVEFRVQKWIGLSVDAQYTACPRHPRRQGGISQEAGETDLGGIAARFKVIVGR